MRLKVNMAIEYSAIFKDGADDIDELLRSIPPLFIIKYFSILQSEIYLKENDQDIQAKLFQRFSGRFPDSEKRIINNYLESLVRQKQPIVIFTHLSNLSMIQYAIENFSNEEERPLSPSEELNLFKAYLLLTEEWVNKPNFDLDQSNKIFGDPIFFLESFMPIQLPVSSLLEVSDMRLQTMKACFLFEFLETSDKYKEVYLAFLSENVVANWHEYLLNIYNAFVAGFISSERVIPPYRISVDSQYAIYRNWLERYAIDTGTYKSDDFFTGIRSKPLFRENDEYYVILSNSFFVNKIYQGVIFDIAIAAQKHSVKVGKTKIKKVLDLKGLLSSDFSEEVLFYGLIESIYEGRSTIQYPGKEIKKIIGEGEPDFLLKDGDNIIICEFKDSSFSNKSKGTYDYKELEKEIFKKLIEKPSDKQKKGLAQLMQVIEDIKLGKYDFVIKKPSKAKIYPVIVITDYTFNLVGVNYMLQKEFERRISLVGNLVVREIKPITLIYIDTLVKFQDLYRNKVINFRKSLDGYHKYLRIQAKKFTQKGDIGMFVSYDKYIHYETINVDYSTPSIFRQKIKEIVEVSKPSNLPDLKVENT